MFVQLRGGDTRGRHFFFLRGRVFFVCSRSEAATDFSFGVLFLRFSWLLAFEATLSLVVMLNSVFHHNLG
jgi:hypothetical protein